MAVVKVEEMGPCAGVFVSERAAADLGIPEIAQQCDGNGTQMSIKIWWDDDRDGLINVTEQNTERFVISFQL